MQRRGTWPTIGRLLVVLGAIVAIPLTARIVFAVTMSDRNDKTFLDNFWGMNFDSLHGWPGVAQVHLMAFVICGVLTLIVLQLIALIKWVFFKQGGQLDEQEDDSEVAAAATVAAPTAVVTATTTINQ